MAHEFRCGSSRTWLGIGRCRGTSDSTGDGELSSVPQGRVQVLAEVVQGGSRTGSKLGEEEKASASVAAVAVA